MNLAIVHNDTIFKEKLIWLKNYFQDLKASGNWSSMYEDASKPLMNTYEIVFENKKLVGEQKRMSTFWPIKDGYSDGEKFLNSEIGILLQETIYYFSHHFILPGDMGTR